VLLVEDDLRMAGAMLRALKGAAVIATDVAATSGEAHGMVRSVAYDAVVLDVMLPDEDGFATCRQLRADGIWVPVHHGGPAETSPIGSRRHPQDPIDQAHIPWVAGSGPARPTRLMYDFG